MAKRVKDPGTGTRNVSGRLLNSNGTFNVKRKGGPSGLFDVYYYLVNTSWFKFLFFIFILYTTVNTVFALVYVACGVENLNGIEKSGFGSDFLNCFFFSAQSLTTVGYGNISPASHLTQLVASFEALVGVLNFALITGVLFGRFSKPVAKIIYSENILIAPYEGGKAYMLRLANLRNNTLIKAHIHVLYSCLETRENGEKYRDYYEMALETDHISTMPLSWTVVHPLNDKSPLYNKTTRDIKNEEGEIVVQFNAYDDTFNDTIHSRYSYTSMEIVENAAFEKAFENTGEHTLLDLDKIGTYRKLY